MSDVGPAVVMRQMIRARPATTPCRLKRPVSVPKTGVCPSAAQVRPAEAMRRSSFVRLLLWALALALGAAAAMAEPGPARPALQLDDAMASVDVWPALHLLADPAPGLDTGRCAPACRRLPAAGHAEVQPRPAPRGGLVAPAAAGDRWRRPVAAGHRLPGAQPGRRVPRQQWPTGAAASPGLDAALCGSAHAEPQPRAAAGPSARRRARSCTCACRHRARWCCRSR